MSKYSEYNYALISSINNLREIQSVIVLLKNTKRKREEPVASYVGNKQANINMANQMLQLAKQRYELALQGLKVSDVIPTNWIPSFEVLKIIAETAEERDA